MDRSENSHPTWSQENVFLGRSRKRRRRSHSPDLGHHRETFLHVDPVLLPDPKQGRAYELARVDLLPEAGAVLSCGLPRWPYPPRHCKQRFCPACGPVMAARNAAETRRRIAAMENPVLALFTMRSENNTDLERTLEALRRSINKIRRRKIFRKVTRGYGFIELVSADNGWNWLPHAHVILDAGCLDVPACQDAWLALTNERGEFGVQAIGNVTALARYISKCAAHCPEVGELRADRFATLIDAYYNRRLVVEWGFRGKRSKENVYPTG